MSGGKARLRPLPHLRFWLGELTAAQREAWVMGEQFDRLSPRVKELALDALHEIDADEPEPSADWLTGVLEDEDEGEDEQG